MWSTLRKANNNSNRQDTSISCISLLWRSYNGELKLLLIFPLLYLKTKFPPSHWQKSRQKMRRFCCVVTLRVIEIDDRRCVFGCASYFFATQLKFERSNRLNGTPCITMAKHNYFSRQKSKIKNFRNFLSSYSCQLCVLMQKAIVYLFFSRSLSICESYLSNPSNAFIIT